MAVHRRRRRRGPSRPRLPRGSYGAILADGDDLGAAADLIADDARERAGEWSSSIPGSISVESDGKKATIWTDAPAAYPNEVDNVRHPTFGHKPWVTNKHRPFLAPAADAKATGAMDRYARKFDRLLEEAGFKPE